MTSRQPTSTRWPGLATTSRPTGPAGSTTWTAWRWTVDWSTWPTRWRCAPTGCGPASPSCCCCSPPSAWSRWRRWHGSSRPPTARSSRCCGPEARPPARWRGPPAVETSVAAAVGGAVGALARRCGVVLVGQDPARPTAIVLARSSRSLARGRVGGGPHRAARSTSRPPHTRTWRGPGGRAGRLVGPGLVTLVAAAAALSVWQLRAYGSPVTVRSDGTPAVDPVAVAAPAALLVAVVLAALTLFPSWRAAPSDARAVTTSRGSWPHVTCRVAWCPSPRPCSPWRSRRPRSSRRRRTRGRGRPASTRPVSCAPARTSGSPPISRARTWPRWTPSPRCPTSTRWLPWRPSWAATSALSSRSPLPPWTRSPAGSPTEPSGSEPPRR